MISLFLVDDFGRQLGLFAAGRSDDANEVGEPVEDCPCPICREWAAEIEARGRRHLAPRGRTPDDSDLTKTESFP